MSTETPAWMADIDSAALTALGAIEAAATLATLREAEVGALGRKGNVTALMKRIGKLDKSERKAFGAAAGGLRGKVTRAVSARREAIVQAAIAAELADTTFDETLPGLDGAPGHVHPLSRVQQELEDVFISMGFSVLDYPEVESEFDNFEALNIPGWHPARDMQDTFWLEGGHLLRTHTSAGQVRAMHQFKPPFRAVFPGKVYRYESTDASHDHTFHQLEGLMIGRHVSVGHLLDSMRTLLSAIFKRDVQVRLRPGYFPFVEPGFELDISCQVCDQKGCSVCKQSGWVELLPCGLVHPNVLRAGGLDPDEWQGWAFGLGLSRLVMMRYGVNDIRLLMGGDARFVEGFHPGT
ncbi:MAG: phenylalanine--tRNA ligase subunit alpha [Myxococcales bacterium]|nr:phenylalanine--tRNA ligase subunit alpha [Myxococcales bacterium]